MDPIILTNKEVIQKLKKRSIKNTIKNKARESRKVLSACPGGDLSFEYVGVYSNQHTIDDFWIHFMVSWQVVVMFRFIQQSGGRCAGRRTWYTVDPQEDSSDNASSAAVLAAASKLSESIEL